MTSLPRQGSRLRRALQVVLVAGPLLGAGAVAFAADEDIETCFDAKGETAIAACTHAIMSGRFTGAPLASLYYNRGYENDSRGEHDLALKDYDEAIRLNPKDSYFTNRAAAYYHKKQYDLALADLSEALKLNPDSAPAFFGRANVYRDKGDYDRAIADFGEAIRLKPGNPHALTSRGEVYLAKGDYDRAIADFDAALKIQPDNKTALAKRQKALDQKSKGKT